MHIWQHVKVLPVKKILLQLQKETLDGWIAFQFGERWQVALKTVTAGQFC